MIRRLIYVLLCVLAVPLIIIACIFFSVGLLIYAPVAYIFFARNFDDCITDMFAPVEFASGSIITTSC